MNECMKQAQLFLLHFAGGNRYSFSSMLQFLRDFEVVSLELPGRGKRMGEPLLKNFELAAADMYRQIAAQLTSPRFVLYGHSMGALLCYLLAKRIAQEKLNAPLHLFLTGKGAPSILFNRKIRHLMPQDELVADLQQMGGMPDIVLKDHKLLDLFLPIIRADFQAVESFRYEEPARLDLPLTVITGSEESIADEKIKPWQLETFATVTFRKLPGGHFFIFNYGREILEMITHALYTYALKDENGTI